MKMPAISLLECALGTPARVHGVPALLGALALSVAPQQGLAQSAAPSAAATPAAARPGRHTLNATLDALTGAVELSPPDPSTPTGHARTHRPAQRGDALEPGARLRVPDEDNASARIRFSNGVLFQVEHHSTVHMFASGTPTPLGATPSTDTTLMRGRVRCVASAPAGATPGRGDRVPLATPGATVLVGAGETVVTVDAGRVTRVMALRGRPRVRVLGRELVLREGQGMRVEQGRPPLPPGALPASPVWTSRFATRTLVAPGRAVALRASFGPAQPPAPRGRGPRVPDPNAPRPVHRYRLQLARDANFADLLVDRLVEPSETTFATGDLGPGTYRARVAVIDADRMEGTFSEPAEFTITAPRVLPGEPGRQASVDLPAGFFCGLDGGPLRAVAGPIAIASARAHRLRCATRADGVDGVDLEISAAQTGPVSHEVRMEPAGFDVSGGMRVLVVRLRDAAGIPVAYADITARAWPEGVSVEPVIEGEERGVYTTRVTWPRGVTGMRIEFTVNQGQRFEFTQGNAPEAPSP